VSKCLDPKGACDTLTIDHPEHASCSALLSAALAPWEGLNAVAFASEALRQIAADLSVLEHSLSEENENGEGPLSNSIVRRFLAGIEYRARAAAEFARRLDEGEAANG